MYVVFLLIAIAANAAVAVLSYMTSGVNWTSLSFMGLAVVAAIATIVSGFLRLPP
jgi:hypothetical protein